VAYELLSRFIKERSGVRASLTNEEFIHQEEDHYEKDGK
jgi:hypothetical protein